MGGRHRTHAKHGARSQCRHSSNLGHKGHGGRGAGAQRQPAVLSQGSRCMRYGEWFKEEGSRNIEAQIATWKEDGGGENDVNGRKGGIEKVNGFPRNPARRTRSLHFKTAFRFCLTPPHPRQTVRCVDFRT